MNVLHRQHAPPSGVDFCVAARILPMGGGSVSRSHAGTPICTLVTVKDTVLQLFLVSRVSGHLVFDWVKEHRLFGVVTGLDKVKTLDTKDDGRDRLLISFKDAKLTLMEWSTAAYDLLPVSLHSYEKLPALTSLDPSSPSPYVPYLTLDPSYRCSALLLPSAQIAILPFYQDHLDFEGLLDDASAALRSFPYAPSFTIDLMAEVNQKIRHVHHIAFLPGYTDPTLAVLYSDTLTWSGRFENVKDAASLALITLDLSSTPTSQKESSGTTVRHTLIFSTDGLPSESHRIVPCPQELGGLVVVAADALLHIDASTSRVTGLAVNAYASTSFPRNTSITSLRLENCRIHFISTLSALLFLPSSEQLCSLRFVKEGRTLMGLSLDPLSKCVPASCFTAIESERAVFVGNRVGDSVLLEWNGSLESKGQGIDLKPVPEVDMDDIYGGGTKDTNGETLNLKHEVVGASSQGKSDRFKLHIVDSLRAWGPIRDMTVCATGLDVEVPTEVVAATGSGDRGGLSVLHRGLPIRKKRTLEIGSDIDQVFCVTLKRENDEARIELIFSSSSLVNEESEQGSTQVFELSDVGEDPEWTKGFEGLTRFAAPILNHTACIRVSKRDVTLLNSELEQVQVVGGGEEEDILNAMVEDDYVFVEKRDGSKGLYVADAATTTLRKIPLPTTAGWISGSVFKAALPLTRTVKEEKPKKNSPTDGQTAMEVEGEDDALYATSKPTTFSKPIQDRMEVEELPSEAQMWLSLTDEKGDICLFTLPSVEEIYKAENLASLPPIVARPEDFQAPIYEDADDAVVSQVITQHRWFMAGSLRPRLHLVVLLEGGEMAAYEVVPDYDTNLEIVGEGKPAIALVKQSARQMDVNSIRSIHSVQFGHLTCGVFITGSNPIWLLASDHGPLRLFESIHSNVNGFSSTHHRNNSCILSTKSGGIFECTLSNYTLLDKEFPTSQVKIGRNYNCLAYDDFSQTLVAASFSGSQFGNFDEEGEALLKEVDEHCFRPIQFRSSLELILPGHWITLDGYEFQPNEWVTSMASIDLDSKSLNYGRRKFIGVGTTSNRAEDLAAKGGIYVFEVLRVNAPDEFPERNRLLRLRYYEETKAAVHNVSGINGYFIHTMGQKLYAKSFEQDERLLAVGFLDIRPHTTCIRVFKNFILLGDATKGVTFIAFQEEPYKLIELGHTYIDVKCSSVDFLALDGRLGIVVTDIDGTIRIFEFNPTNIESQAGQKLLCRTEYHSASEVSVSLPFAKRSTTKGETNIACITCGCQDGSINSLVPAKEPVYKRLQLLQSRLIRHIQHFARLNPRGFRTVRNDTVSRAINRGILDGEVLSCFEMMSIEQQQEMARLISSDRETILLNIQNLRGLW